MLVANTGEIVQSPTRPQPKITETIGEDVITVTYTIDSLLVTRPYGDSTVCLHLDGFGYTSAERLPPLPAKNVRLGGGRKQWMILNAVRISSIPTKYSYAIAWPEESDDGGEVDTMDVVIPEIPLDKFYPEQVVTDRGYEEYRGERFLNLAIAPVQYNHATKELKINNSITYQLIVADADADESSEINIAGDDRYYSLINGDVDYPPYIQDPIDPVSADRSYLIISVDDTKKAANTLATHKRKFGYKAHVANRSSWSRKQVRDSIKSYFADDPDLYYVILLGDRKKIPAYYADPNASTTTSYTDFPYSCYGWPDDLTPDFYLGRIPFSDSETALLAVYKTISFEENPAPNMTSSRMGICSEFEDVGGNGYERDGVTYYAHLANVYADNFVDDVLPLFAYNNSSRGTPLGWSSKYTYDTNLPLYLNQRNHDWSPAGNSPKPLVERGCNLLIHRGHASATRWNLPTFTATDAAGLVNEVLPIVFGLNCESGRYWVEDNVSRALLANSRGGAAAVVAPTQTIATKVNHTMLLGFMNSIWPNPGMTCDSSLVMKIPPVGYNSHQGASSIGEMMSIALSHVDQYCLPSAAGYDGPVGNTNRIVRQAYHCLGDPGLVPFWNSLTDLTSVVSATVSDGTISLRSKIPVTFSLWDPSNFTSRRVYGSYYNYNVSALTDVAKVIVHAFLPGARPIKVNLTGRVSSGNLGSGLLKTIALNGYTLTITTESIPYGANYTLKIQGGRGEGHATPLVPGSHTYTFDMEKIKPFTPGNFYVLTVETEDEVLIIKKIRE